MSGRGASLRRGPSNVDKAIAVALQQRKDLQQTSVIAMMELVGEDPIAMAVSLLVPKEETVASKLKASLPENPTDPVELARHFNQHFKPLLQVRECVEYDEFVEDPVLGGNLPIIINVILNSLRQLKAAPQIRILSALKRFYRAVSTMSRLIRRRNSRRHDMLLEVVKWWETREAEFRQKLDSDMQSPLFRFHNEIVKIIETKQNLTIPAEVKFGIVKLLYFRQRMHNAKNWFQWSEKIKASLKLLRALKKTGERTSSGRYPEPLESRVRSLRRAYFAAVDKCPQDASFDPQTITYDRLMDVKNELARVRSAENRARLLEDFHRALKTSKERMKQSYDLMEARREEEYKKRAAQRRVQMEAFEDVQRQRHDVMRSGSRGNKNRRSSSVVTLKLDEHEEEDASHRSQRDRCGESAIDPLESSACSPRDSSTMSQNRSQSEDGASPRLSRVPSMRSNSSSSERGGVGGGDGLFMCATSHEERSHPPRRVSVVQTGTVASYVSGGNASAHRDSAEGSVSWGSGGGLRRLSSGVMPARRFSEGSPTVRVQDLAYELEANPLLFLEKFGTAAYEDALRERERKFRLELAASGMDEERQYVQELVLRRKLTPTPLLEPFFLSEQHPPPDPDRSTMAHNEACGVAPGRVMKGGFDASVLSLNSDGCLSMDDVDGPGTTFKLRAEDESIRVHYPMSSQVRLRQYPINKRLRDIGPPGERARSAVGLVRLKRAQSVPLSAPTNTPIVVAPVIGALSETSLFRPMSKALGTAVNPWKPQLREPSVSRRATSPMKSATPTPSTTVAQRTEPRVEDIRGETAICDAPASRLGVPLTPYQSAVQMIKEGHVVLNGQDRNPVQQLLRSHTLSTDTARQHLVAQRDCAVRITPPVVGWSAPVNTISPNVASNAAPKQSPQQQTSHHKRGQQPASFLRGGTSSPSLSYKQKLQDIMIASAGL